MKSVLFCICFSFILLVSQNKAAKILAVFPTPSVSHQVVFRPIVHELAKRGHEVTIITPNPAFPRGGAPSNLTEIDVHDISYKIWKVHLIPVLAENCDLRCQMILFETALVKVFDAQIRHTKVQNIIGDATKKFDLLLTESSVRVSLLFSHIYKVPVIQISSFAGLLDNYDVFGISKHPFLYPPITHQRLHNLTMKETFDEFYHHYLIENIYEDNKMYENELLKKHFGDNAPTVSELNQNVHMLFLNMHPMFEGIKPMPQSVVVLSGLHQTPEKNLPTDLKAYLDSSKNGVIYVSFGTNADPSRFPKEVIQAMVTVFSRLPYDVLWKWNNDELPGRTANIKIAKWFPQSDLLRHPKIKLFIMQGGLQSTDEAITAGVPMIGIPILGDQWFNIERCVYHNIGIRIDLQTLTEEKFKVAINTIINDDNYRKNVVHLRTLMVDEPMRSLDRAVRWVEYVLRHGGATHLRSPAANLTWTEYFELDLVLLITAVLLVFSIMFIVALRFVYNFLLGFSTKFIIYLYFVYHFVFRK